MSENETSEQLKISDDLVAIINELKEIVETHALLNQEATFKASILPVVARSIQYLSRRHSELLQKAKEHKDAHLVPELNGQV